MKRDQSRSHLSWGLRKRPFLWCRLRAYLWSFMAWNSMLAIEYPPFYVIRISKLLSAHSTVQCRNLLRLTNTYILFQCKEILTQDPFLLLAKIHLPQNISSFSTFDVTNCFCNDWQKKVDKEKVSIISGHFL